MNKYHNMSIMENICQDIEIILVDSNNTLSIRAHKCILECSSTYFHNLFCFGKEKTQSSIRIGVDNAKVAHDIIMLFYGQKINSVHDPKYLLEMLNVEVFFLFHIVICKNIFCK